jgi:hypothetical protein
MILPGLWPKPARNHLKIKLSTTDLNDYPELGRLHYWPDMLIFPAHFHKTVVRHGFEGAGQVSRFAASHVGQRRDGMRLCIADDFE